MLSARGFVTPQPHKRPKSSFVRFEAAQLNERRQVDITHRLLCDGADAGICNWLDDHSRLCLTFAAAIVFTARESTGSTAPPHRLTATRPACSPTASSPAATAAVEGSPSR